MGLEWTKIATDVAFFVDRAKHVAAGMAYLEEQKVFFFLSMRKRDLNWFFFRLCTETWPSGTCW